VSTSAQVRKETEAKGAEQTTCCVVGGGPAGAMLALLLARQEVEVTLLEAHRDFERDFRGDTLHASTMEILDEIGLADRLLELRHAKVRHFTLSAKGGAFTFDLFAGLRTRFPYIVVMAQSRFLEFITDEAKRYPNFRLAMGARVEELLEEDGVVRGVRYRGRDGWREVRATLTVGADGRFSKVRRLAGFDPVKISSPIDVLWFRISRREEDPKEALAARVGSGMFMVFIDRFEYWQVGCTIVKGGYKVVRASGLDRLRRSLARVAPEWADRFEELKEWKQIPVLSVEISRLKRWHKPGLLLIGDAAHVMSPLGGVGINYAIQDAVVASNVLGEKLRTEEPIREQDLAEVQRRRGLPIRAIQTFQSLGQKGVTRGVLSSEGERAFTLPRFVLPLLNSPRLLAIPARFLSFGLRPPHVDFSGKKRLVRVGGTLVAYYEEGDGKPILLLHGCPFSSFVWRKVIPLLSRHYRCIAPDLLGLGDTETPEGADWSLRSQADMIVGFLDALGIERAHVVGHDHGGALAQLLAAEHPHKIDRLVISNAEAYDNWPSEEERPFVRATQVPVLGDVVMWLYSRRAVFRLTLKEAKAVYDPRVLSAELLDGYIRANLSDRHRRARTRRFLAGQFDPENNRTTMDLLDGLRRFDHPTLLVWAREDPHFGPVWGERLYRDIPGAVGLELLPETGHLLMEERPERFAALVADFLSDPMSRARRKNRDREN
jgi:2-polyprenyl-6-methoxyphenol hydroxylase-like FAD-dependent oxidoreductase/pimeloyl-ACP methyl ester carboxylesterase